jgi:hypothetical protein
MRPRCRSRRYKQGVLTIRGRQIFMAKSSPGRVVLRNSLLQLRNCRRRQRKASIIYFGSLPVAAATLGETVGVPLIIAAHRFQRDLTSPLSLISPMGKAA